MRKSILRASAGLQALAILGAGTTAAFIAAPASAQDYTSGAVNGNVSDNSGKPLAGATVTLTSIAQNQARTLTTDGAGNFSASGLAAGEYTIAVNAGGYAPYSGTITITAAQQSQLNISLVSATASREIIVTGTRLRQVQTQATTGLNVDVQNVNANAPIGHSITAVTLLAPTAQRGVSAFGDVPSVGGSSVAENAYYINGLNITNFDNYLGGAEVPFDFYKSVEIKSGGYSAEFGRATGGIVNAVSKSGSNDFDAALHLNWAPDFLRSDNKNLLTCGYDDASNTTFTGGPARPWRRWSAVGWAVRLTTSRCACSSARSSTRA